jgi:putative SOS response-associated peptidase YedK
MCGRYATTRSDADLTLLFDTVDVTESLAPSHPNPSRPSPSRPSPSHLSPSWNVAPTDPVPVVRVSASQEARVLDTARWGLVPPWAADLRAGARMINARAETVATSKAFASSFARRRCLVPADGWFEWVRDGGRKQPFYLTPADGAVLAFAGLWSAWGPESVLTCSVLTTAALGDLARVHDRMPLILPRERWSAWLAGGGDGAELLQPMTEAELASIEVRPVRPDVGNVRNNGPELIAPLDEELTTPTLF